MNSLEFDRWAKYVRETLLPLITLSEVTCCIVPKSPRDLDVKIATELGVSILADKPIIALIRPGTETPEKLAAVVDRFVEFDPSNPEAAVPSICQAIRELVDGEQDDDSDANS